LYLFRYFFLYIARDGGAPAIIGISVTTELLEWDGDGFWLYFKRLEKGHFRWPAEGAGQTMMLTVEELNILLGGARVEVKLRRNEVLERGVM